MKYMTFNSSCSYAGVANMLERYGVDTEDRDIALGMKLPYLFSYEGGVYMAGPMLQSADWFNLYLNPIGFEMIEKEVPAKQVSAYLMQQKTAMLGLRVDDTGKHAVVYIGGDDHRLTFLNNKWKDTDAPAQILLTETELLSQLAETTMVATLRPTAPKATDLKGRMKNAMVVIRKNLAEMQTVCCREETVGQLRKKRNTLFRPLLLDGITMLRLIEENNLANEFALLQQGLLNALRQDADQRVTLRAFLSMEKLMAAGERYIQLIQAELTK